MPISDRITTLVIAPTEPRAAIAVQPALNLWKHKYPLGSITVLANTRVATVFKLIPEVSEVISVPNALLGDMGKIALFQRLRQRPFTHCFQLATGSRASALGALLNINQRHQPNANWLNDIYASGDSAALSRQFAALMIGITERVKTPADLPIELPAPVLRADAVWQRRALEKMGIPTLWVGEQSIRPVQPLFLLHGGTAATLSAAIASAILARWSSAQVALICHPRTMQTLSLPAAPQVAANITFFGAPAIADTLALLASATAVISADEFAIQASAAFMTPTVFIPNGSLKASHSSRRRLSSLLPSDIIANLERVLRFDGSSANIHRVS